MVDIEEWTGPGAKELPSEHRPLQPDDNCVLMSMVSDDGDNDYVDDGACGDGD